MIYIIFGIVLSVVAISFLGYSFFTNIFLFLGVVVFFLLKILLNINKSKNVAENNQEEKLCAIVSAKDEEETIRRSIKSLLSQSYKNIEIVLVDDGSTDSTYKIMCEYQKMYPDRIHVKRNEKGQGKLKNILRVTEEFDADIYFVMDADNIIPENYIEYYVKRMKDVDVTESTLGAYNEKDSFPALMHTIEIFLLSFLRYSNIFSSFTGRGMFIRKKVFEYIKNHLNYQGVDDGAMINSAVDQGRFKFKYFYGPVLLEYATVGMEDFVKQRFRWYGKGMAEAVENGAKRVLVSFGIEIGGILSIVILPFFSHFNILFLVEFLSVLSIIGIELKIFYKLKSNIVKTIVGIILMVFVDAGIVLVSFLQLKKFKKKLDWYKVKKN
ncbi:MULTISPECIES: glycosyltransferase [unclassified Thermosipho (in: thermotogales)]|uniref:glycosyltransferase n=1 Tax=unclassified Thermosipho (in: thermotogales) TaxID=2676525 RepID=UPI000986D8FA|nr:MULTISPECIES: glycosyltransferase [unclassified Thermosipho (in: thermotogales)]MBT1248345.1 hypothetical protein [Thermosipho sp. 1244]OOC47478.1 hypothetical protein XO09_00540 [Thermosipho sp. 1223]